MAKDTRGIKMRRICFAAFSLVCSTVVASQLAYATGNVLLPQDSPSTDSSSYSPYVSNPNPSQNNASPAAASPGAQPPVTAPSSSNNAASAITPTVPPSPNAVVGQTPATPNFKLSDLISPVNPETAKHLPPGAIPTQVIHSPSLAPLMAQAGQNLPYNLTISFSGKSFFGEKDAQAISQKLGLSRKEIPVSCNLTLSGIVHTDKGNSIIVSDALPPVSIRYDGIIKSYVLVANAMCTAATLPPGSGYIRQYGDRYDVALQQISCTPPNRQVTSLLITYDGSGTSQCDYQ